ncbi:hypothetical protein GGR57DRAFT_517683 [Xylariaceae sp. FL1272]|nr:hypothetical protein GGR57DRAFT_517683 [Xylariaceae sp. FL1272]
MDGGAAALKLQLSLVIKLVALATAAIFGALENSTAPIIPSYEYSFNHHLMARQRPLTARRDAVHRLARLRPADGTQDRNEFIPQPSGVAHDGTYRLYVDSVLRRRERNDELSSEVRDLKLQVLKHVQENLALSVKNREYFSMKLEVANKNAELAKSNEELAKDLGARYTTRDIFFYVFAVFVVVTVLAICDKAVTQEQKDAVVGWLSVLRHT